MVFNIEYFLDTFWFPGSSWDFHTSRWRTKTLYRLANPKSFVLTFESFFNLIEITVPPHDLNFSKFLNRDAVFVVFQNFLCFAFSFGSIMAQVVFQQGCNFRKLNGMQNVIPSQGSTVNLNRKPDLKKAISVFVQTFELIFQSFFVTFRQFGYKKPTKTEKGSATLNVGDPKKINPNRCVK